VNHLPGIASVLPVLFMRRPYLGITGVSMCFPDPWFKSRHHKRRVSQPEVLDAVGQYVSLGCVAHGFFVLTVGSVEEIYNQEVISMCKRT